MVPPDGVVPHGGVSFTGRFSIGLYFSRKRPEEAESKFASLLFSTIVLKKKMKTRIYGAMDAWGDGCMVRSVYGTIDVKGDGLMLP